MDGRSLCIRVRDRAWHVPVSQQQKPKPISRHDRDRHVSRNNQDIQEPDFGRFELPTRHGFDLRQVSAVSLFLSQLGPDMLALAFKRGRGAGAGGRPACKLT